jgi:hypothetical protein
MAKPKKELPFNVHKYQPAPKNNQYTDGAGSLANQLSHIISFRNIRNDQDVLFKAFIMDFNESYTPNFTPNEVFGRTDPIYQYKNTTRSISLSFKIPASTESEAFENLGRVQKLVQMLYPSYQDTNSGLSLSEAPLVRMKVMNILRNHASLGGGTDDPTAKKKDADYFTEYTSTADPGKGLLGVITNATVNSMLNSADGVFHKLTTVPQDEETGDPAVTRAEPNTVLPKLIEVTINFAPIHEETLGYATFGMDMEQPIGNFHRFPYGVELAKDAAGPALPPSVSDAVAKEREEAEKQRKAASAQQEEDKKKSKSTKLFNKANRKERRADRRQGRLDRRQGTLDETRGEIEDLRTEAMFQSAVEDGLFEGEPAGSVDAGRFMV